MGIKIINTDIQNIQDSLRTEFGVEITVTQDDAGNLEINVPKGDGVKEKLPQIAKRLSVLVRQTLTSNFFKNGCFIYFFCADARGKKHVIRGVGSQRLSDAELLEDAYRQFGAIKRRYITVGGKKGRLKKLDKVRVARDAEQAAAIDLEIKADFYNKLHYSS